MKKIISIITLGTLLITGNLHAGKDFVEADTEIVLIPDTDSNPFYIGAGLTWAGISKDCICLTPTGEIHYETHIEDKTWGGIVKVGYNYNQYFALEARLLNVNNDSNVFDITHYGLYLKPMIPINESIDLYALLGYGHNEIDDYCDMSKTFKHDGFSYGVGLEYDLSGHDTKKGWGLWIDYQNLMTDETSENYTANVVNFGVSYNF
ncbi:MAG: porin family protein [Campylobacterota bacterium]|nr:porin family protein [Campylobacterota bacterium]